MWRDKGQRGIKGKEWNNYSSITNKTYLKNIKKRELGTEIKVLNVFCLLGLLVVEQGNESGPLGLEDNHGFHI